MKSVKEDISFDDVNVLLFSLILYLSYFLMIVLFYKQQRGRIMVEWKEQQ